MKKIAFLTDGWKRYVTYAWNIGIAESIKNYHEPVSMMQFNAFGTWSENEEYNRGEYNIFELPDLSSFDGILCDFTNISDRNILNRITGLIKASGVPAVSLGRRISGLYYVGIDNRNTLEKLMRHLHNMHGCRSFIYAGGPRNNMDNRERVQAYLDSIRAFGLDPDKNPVWVGDYTFDSGYRYFENYYLEVQAGRSKLPDAFVCANDNIATGLMVSAQGHGFNIPGDFIVTGFDNIDQSKHFSPHITTIEQNRESIGALAVSKLFDIWEGRDVSLESCVENVCVFTQSCGCIPLKETDSAEYIKYCIKGSETKVRLENDLAKCQIMLSTAKTFEECYDAVREYICTQDCESFAIILDKKLFTLDNITGLSETGYDLSQFDIVFYQDKGSRHVFSNVAELMDSIASDDENSEFLFSPLHSEEKQLGFVVLKNGRYLFDNPFYCNLLLFLTQTIFRLFRTRVVDEENEKLEYMYRHDQMTGVYNRQAFGQMAKEFMEKHHANRRSIAIGFVDADNFKKINDTYGHDRGDEVLTQIAHTLQDKCPGEGFVFRFGGDEFIIMFDPSCKSADRLISEVDEALGRDGISVSIGIILSDYGNTDKTVGDYLKDADALMYKIKAEKKQNR